MDSSVFIERFNWGFGLLQITIFYYSIEVLKESLLSLIFDFVLICYTFGSIIPTQEIASKFFLQNLIQSLKIMKSLWPLCLSFHNRIQMLLSYSLRCLKEVSNSWKFIIFFQLQWIQVILLEELSKHDLEFISHNINSSFLFSFGLMTSIFELLLGLLETI